MKVTPQDVGRVAELASLELTAAERERMLRDLNDILEYINRLNELDTTDVAPMSHPAASLGAAAGTPLRSDETRASLPHDAAMHNAPQSGGVYFEVPKVIER